MTSVLNNSQNNTSEDSISINIFDDGNKDITTTDDSKRFSFRRSHLYDYLTIAKELEIEF